MACISISVKGKSDTRLASSGLQASLNAYGTPAVCSAVGYASTLASELLHSSKADANAVLNTFFDAWRHNGELGMESYFTENGVCIICHDCRFEGETAVLNCYSFEGDGIKYKY